MKAKSSGGKSASPKAKARGHYADGGPVDDVAAMTKEAEDRAAWRQKYGKPQGQQPPAPSSGLGNIGGTGGLGSALMDGKAKGGKVKHVATKAAVNKGTAKVTVKR